jgi:hypothetical protein
MENSMEAPKNLKIELSYDTAIPLLGIYPMECKSVDYRDTYTPMFIAALFTIAKKWKQPRCPITDKWIKNMWYLYTVKFYSTIKKNEILSFAGKWIKLKIIFLKFYFVFILLGWVGVYIVVFTKVLTIHQIYHT